MAVPYQQLLRNTALRLSALTGIEAVTIEAVYATNPLTASLFKSADWPFSSFRDAILMAEEQFSEVAAASVDEHGTGNHVWRSSLAAVTAALTTNSVIPPTETGGAKIIGAYGEVVDNVDGTVLTKRSLDEVRLATNTTWRKYQLYYYAMTGRRISHTRASVVVNVCKYDRAAQVTSYNAASNMVLPDTAEPGITALAVSLMTRDGAFASQAELYAKFAAESLMMVGKGGVPSAIPAAA